jgi:replicative DNA helicase
MSDALAYQPPHDDGAELTVLSGLINDESLLEALGASVRPSDFYAPLLSKACANALRIAETSPLDVLVLGRSLVDAGEDPAQVQRLVAEVSTTFVTPGEFKARLKLFRDLSYKRKLWAAAVSYLDRMNGITPAQAKQAWEAALDVDVPGDSVRHEWEAPDLAVEVLEQYERVEKGQVSSIGTGFPSLDAMIGGYAAGQLIILAARPSMGKSTLALSMALNQAVYQSEHGHQVAVFSLEMTAREWGTNALANLGALDGTRIRRAELDGINRGVLLDASEALSGSTLFIDDTPGISVQSLCRKARRRKKTKGLDVLYVDYLQLITTAGRGNKGRHEEVGAISGALKELAKELECTVVALAQLNRKVEERQDKKPQLADLRESGSVEQDADMVILLTRPGYYGLKENPEDEAAIDDGRSAVIIAKNRNGPTGEVELYLKKSMFRFEER